MIVDKRRKCKSTRDKPHDANCDLGHPIGRNKSILDGLADGLKMNKVSKSNNELFRKVNVSTFKKPLKTYHVSVEADRQQVIDGRCRQQDV